MKNVNQRFFQGRTLYYVLVLTILCSITTLEHLSAQCVPQSNSIEGKVFADINNNGIIDPGEVGVSNVRVNAFDQYSTLIGTTLSDQAGNFILSNLVQGAKVRLVYQYATNHFPTYLGENNTSSIQFVSVPACNASLGLMKELDYCNESTTIVTTCFVQGSIQALPNEPTIVGIKYGFDLGSPATKYAMNGSTGSIWGLAWNSKSKLIYSSAFVKQYAGLTNHGHDAIFKTDLNVAGNPTSLFVRLRDLGQNVGNLAVTNINDCAYGAQVGKIGLGAIQISQDNKDLYVINLFNNTLVKVKTENPTDQNTVTYQIPDPGCSNGEYRAFALKMYNDKLYVGVTCTAETAKSEASSSANVYEFDPSKGTFSLIFTTNYIKGYWRDNNPGALFHAHWLTDIDFTDDGNMLISLTDRLGHRFCTSTANNRLDEQKPDLLMVWFDETDQTWKLESNGKAGNLTGSGVGNGQGPNGGEFFGFDNWVSNPIYHSETALGSIFVMPNTGTVVATVFDPHVNAYSGGLHRYSTTNGDKVGAKELYVLDTNVAFGKATGFGEIISLCVPPQIEIGNRVWNDENRNGLQDADEAGISGVKLNIYNDNCELEGTTTSDINGQYVFNDSNINGGILPGKTYFVAIDQTIFDENIGAVLLNGEFYTLTKSTQDNPLLDSDAVMGSTSCDYGVYAFNTNKSNHTFDIGLAISSECNLLLQTEFLGNELIKIDDILTFEICVANRGGVLVKGYTIETKLPNGYVFYPELNTGWVQNGNTISKSILSDIHRGGHYCDVINLKFDPSAQTISFSHEFYITKLVDRNGVLVTEISDCFDQNDDSKSNIVLQSFDLALRQVLNDNQVITYGSDVKINTTVFNQGNVVAGSYEIVNYLNPELEFDQVKNPNWVLDNTTLLLKYKDNIPLHPGENRTVMLILTVKNSSPVGNIINYAEIANAWMIDGKEAIDFDSYPDSDQKNDIGGIVDSITDDMIIDHMVIDEDDQDPVKIVINIVDVALQKKVGERRAFAGGNITYDIDVINEGTVAISRVTIVDYLPNTLVLADDSWVSLPNGYAEKEIIFVSPLLPGQTWKETITFNVVEIIPHPSTIKNIAEIKSIVDINGNDISLLDIDSNLNSFISDQNSGMLNYLDEDDISEAYVIIICPIEITSPCECKNNASNSTNGQFDVTLKLASEPNEEWHIEQIVGLFDPASPAPPALPIPFATGPLGYLLDEMPHENGIHSYYVLEAIHIHNQGFSIRLQNKFGDIEEFILPSSTCRYNTLDIVGPTSVCNTATSVFSVLNISGATYNWSIDGSPVVGSGNVLNVNWNGYSSGNHVVIANINHPNDCFAPSILNVTTGVADAQSIACIGDFNVSLNDNCEMTITPNMIIAGVFNASAPYSVMLKDKHGNLIPNATLTHEHLGTRVMAKVIDGCGGNSCWSSINVEDKIAPRSLCQDIVLPCYRLDAYGGPFETDNCGGNVVNTLLSESITPLTCDPHFIKLIDRVYQAVDVSGNKSALCSMRISLQRPDFGLIKLPNSLTIANDSVLVCDNFPLENGFPSTSVTGVPTLQGLPLYPVFSPVCNLYAGYTDMDLGQIGCVRKIMRNWMIYEQWCSNGRMINYTQTIEITDTIPPVIAPMQNFTVSATQGQCMARVQLPTPTVSDECVGVLEVNIAYPGGFLTNQNTGLVDLSLGNNKITYTVYDLCRNSTSTSIIITVEDRTAPITICKGEIVVSLNASGEAYLGASQVNDGSFDACGIAKMEVRRMTNTCKPNADVFGTYVDFCCADVTDPASSVVVELRVTDLSNNSNTCMVNVTVQDKFPPQITCPDNVTINCDTPFDLTDLSIYKTATAIDACGARVVELAAVPSLNVCNEGFITRTFEARDNLGFARCQQLIYLVNPSPFNPFTDVTRPSNYESFDGCTAADLHPDNLPAINAYPIIREGFCDMASAAFSDQVFNFVPGACFKIVRTWTVIDWCEMDRDPDYVPYVFTQTLIVQNDIAPVITSSCAPDTVSTPKGDCFFGSFNLFATAEDVCTPDALLKWILKVDLDNNGTYELDTFGYGATIDVTKTYPVGDHRAQYTFEDRCGNLTSCDQLFSIKNFDGPTASCYEEVSVALIPMDTNGDLIPDIEMACILAHTLNVSSNHPCNLYLTYSFSADTTFKELCFDCFNLGINEVDLWVTDENGGTSICTVTVDVQDNNDVDVCPDLEQCIAWPADVSQSGCNIPLELIGLDKVPEFDTDCVCDDYDVAVTNNPTTSCGAGCIAQQRIWTVTFNCYSRPVVFTYTQTITSIDQTPTASITGDTIICNGQSAMLMASGGGTYLWNNGFTQQNITVSPSSTTTYTVTVTSVEGCTDVASIIVTVNTLPTAQIMGNNIICSGNSTTLVASGGGTYLWNNGVTTASNTVSPLATTTYTVTVTGTNGCTAVASRTVTVNPLPNAQIGGSNVICLGQSTNLTASGGGTYLWSTGANTATILVNPMINTTYSVTVTGTNGCTAVASRTVTVNPLPNAAVTGNNNICIGQPTTLVASGGVSYAWSNNMNTSSITVSPLVNTTYTVTVTGSNGCTAVVSRSVTVNPLPLASISGDTLICDGDSTVLTAFGGGTYVWSTGENTASITVTPMQTTTYTVTVTSIAGCSATAQQTVSFDSGVLECLTQDVTVYLDENGTVVITPDLISIGSNQGCNGEIELSVDPDMFFCNNAGINNIVTLTVRNTNSNDSLTCTATVMVLDTLVPMLVCPGNMTFGCLDFDPNAPLEIYGELEFSDNCLAGLVVDELPITDLNTCNVGSITRTFTVTDFSGNSSQCVQTITVTATNAITLDDITFPQDTLEVTNCEMTDPEFTGNTTVDDSNADCANVSIAFVDVSSNPGGCLDTITRTWTVIDSCQLISGTNNGIFVFIQTIIVTDNVAPVLFNLPSDSTIILGPDQCSIYFDASGITVQDCDTNLQLSNTGFYADNDQGLDPSGTYFAGVYPIDIIATDGCGNTTTYTFTLRLIIFREYCLKPIRNITDDQTVTIYSEEINAYDSLCEVNFFIISYSDTDPLDTVRVYGCEDVGTFPVTLYIWETLFDTIIYDSCITLFEIRDPNNFCGGRPAGIYGDIITEYNEIVKHVEVDLIGSGMPKYMTNDEGKYEFMDMEAGGSYQVVPKKDDGLLDGVSTLDLIYIQQHMLGISPFISPYQWIAADINNDKRINTSDMVELRKAILGVHSRFPNNNSWKMIDKNFKFVDPQYPFATPISEQYDVVNLDKYMKVDFVGVKIGDVNGSYKSNLQQEHVSSRNSSKYFFGINDAPFKAGERVEIPVFSLENDKMLGFQIAIQTNNLSDIEIVSETIKISPEHYVQENGFLVISWTTIDPVSLNAGVELFRIIGKGNKSASVAQSLNIEEAILKPEFYTADKVSKSLSFNVSNKLQDVETFVLIGNAPNPWTDETQIQFFVPQDGEVQLVLRDVTGKLISVRKEFFSKGNHSFIVVKDQIQKAGILFYDLRFNHQVYSSKMVFID